MFGHLTMAAAAPRCTWRAFVAACAVRSCCALLLLLPSTGPTASSLHLQQWALPAAGKPPNVGVCVILYGSFRSYLVRANKAAQAVTFVTMNVIVSTISCTSTTGMRQQQYRQLANDNCATTCFCRFVVLLVSSSVYRKAAASNERSLVNATPFFLCTGVIGNAISRYQSGGERVLYAVAVMQLIECCWICVSQAGGLLHGGWLHATALRGGAQPAALRAPAAEPRRGGHCTELLHRCVVWLKEEWVCGWVGGRHL